MLLFFWGEGGCFICSSFIYSLRYFFKLSFSFRDCSKFHFFFFFTFTFYFILSFLETEFNQFIICLLRRNFSLIYVIFLASFFFLFFLVINGWSSYGIVTKLQACGLEVNTFEFQSLYYVHFRINTLEER